MFINPSLLLLLLLSSLMSSSHRVQNSPTKREATLLKCSVQSEAVVHVFSLKKKKNILLITAICVVLNQKNRTEGDRTTMFCIFDFEQTHGPMDTSLPADWVRLPCINKVVSLSFNSINTLLGTVCKKKIGVVKVHHS